MDNIPLALNLTFVGMTVVFIALILLSFIIFISTKFLAVKKNGRAKKNTTKDEASILEIDDDEDMNLDIPAFGRPDEELVSVMMAAIKAGMSPESQCSLRIKSFRRIEQSSPVWNRAGRLEQIAKKL
ncbi:MAG: hypothetical protein FIA99_01635 [Ruminiclostridium sp.]|nr:hypothetical protein [Ruminiclostridium sp.]